MYHLLRLEGTVTIVDDLPDDFVLNHIDFNLVLISEETNTPKRYLKLNFITKVLIPELKLQMNNKFIFIINFESKCNK